MNYYKSNLLLIVKFLIADWSQSVCFRRVPQLFNSFRGHLEYQGAKKLGRKQKLPRWTTFSSREPVVPFDRGSLNTRDLVLWGQKMLERSNPRNTGKEGIFGSQHAFSISAPLLHDVFKNARSVFFLYFLNCPQTFLPRKAYRSWLYVMDIVFIFFAHVYSCLTALNN